MTRQDTSAIVDAVMADVIGGGLETRRSKHEDEVIKEPGNSPDSKLT